MDKPTVKDIKIDKVENKGDDKGPVFNFNLFGQRTFVTAYSRHAGLETNGHFHKGDDPSRDPEIIYLVAGKIQFDFEDLEGNKSRETLYPGEVITIPKLIFHKYHILSSSAFFESRISEYDPQNPDTYSYDDFLQLQDE